MLLRPGRRVPGADPGSDLLATDPWGHRLSAAADADAGQPSPWPRRLAWLVPALAMALVGGVGLTRPALWTDELATWGMAETPWGRMWPVLRGVDAVIAPYYTLMRGWSELAGTSDLALRLPSLAAMVAVAGLIGALGTRLAGPRLGLLAGLLFAVLPSSSRFAQEARPYALTALAAIGATYLLVRAWDRPSAARWAAYAVAVAALGALHVVALVLPVAHAWIAVAWHRATVLHWLAAATAGVLPLLPLVWLGAQQRRQVAHIAEVGLGSAGPYATVVLGSIGVAVLVAALGLFGLPLRYPGGLFAAWIVLPAATLVVLSLVFSLFLPRYLIFTAPAWALLGGAALARLRPAVAALVLTCVTVLALPAHRADRAPDGHDEATRTVAQTIQTHVREGDAVVYAAAEARGGWTTRDLVAHYLPADRRPTDVLLERPPRTDGQLLAGECPDVPACLGRPERVWVIRLGSFADPLTGLGRAKEAVLRADYQVRTVWRPRNLTLALLVLNPDEGTR